MEEYIHFDDTKNFNKMARQRRTPHKTAEPASYEPVAAPFLPTDYEPAPIESSAAGVKVRDFPEIPVVPPQEEVAGTPEDSGTDTKPEVPVEEKPQADAAPESEEETPDAGSEEPDQLPEPHPAPETPQAEAQVQEQEIGQVSVRDTIRARQRAAETAASDKNTNTGSTLKGIIASRKPQSSKLTASEEIRNRQLGRKAGTSVSQVIFDRRYRRN